MKTFAAVLLLLAACAAWPAAAAPQRRVPALKVRAKGRNILLTERGRAHVLGVADKIDAARVKGVTLVFESRAAGFLYLLLDVCGMSKERSDDRQCGAGVECNLLWVKLDARRRVAAADSARYESCWAPITSEDGYNVAGRTLRMQFTDLRERLEYKLTYDADRPERGLQIETSPAPGDP